MEIRTRQNIERVEKQGKTRIYGIKSCKTYRKALQVLIGKYYKKGNKELEMHTRGLLELYSQFHPDTKHQTPNKIWDEVDKQIEKSGIKRYNWHDVFENSLTKEILKLKKSGLSVDEAYERLKEDGRVKAFIETKLKEKDKILENLKISVHARYGENNTAFKVMIEDER